MSVTNIEEKHKHEVSELICLKCLHRWVGVYPLSTPLKNLECTCGEVGYVIKTGQTIEEPDINPKRDNDVRYQNLVNVFGEEIAKEKYRIFCTNDEW